MDRVLGLVLFFTVIFCGTASAADTCDVVEGLEGCACIMRNSSKVVSLQDLVGNNTNGKPIRFDRADGNKKDWYFAYHPCGTFDMFLNRPNPRVGDYPCKDTSVGRFTDNANHICEGLGDLSESKFEFNEGYEYPVVAPLSVVFRNTSSSHGARISLVCNETLSVEDTEFKYLNVTEGPTEYYHFSLTGPCSCPGGCKYIKPKPKPSNAMTNLPNLGFIFVTAIMMVLSKL
ncbi:uncharacterized protein [Clytia hemisphaerica]|uniref:uncharacterized protein n=1 Tax=Clytia hemisphaerica TaxID=252671 RepID=UPI0034D6C7A3